MRCPMYRSTADGTRCILIPPEEWRISRAQLEKYCNNGGSGCSIYARYMSARGKS
ncbi:metal-binding protein [Thermoproteus uzoniensis]|nr:metal-binding protein [Thermoproteus uzoniensis]